jgi:purine catabolism regulator
MALTVGDLLRTPGFDLRVAAGREGLRGPIRWVHVSELEDPTPWLKGGELLLTTGIGVGKTPARQRAYVDRLAKAGLTGLGFGLGFSFQRVPKAMVEAADKASFPIFEVPYAMPFIAITEAVFSRLVAEQYDVLARSLDAEHSLTRTVLDGQGLPGIVSALIRATGGWAVLLDLHGAALATVPEAAGKHIPWLWAELQSPRAEGARFSLSLVEGGDHVMLQPVAAQGRVEAFLAIGKRDAFTQFDRIVFSHALSLLAIELSKTRAVSEAERRLKGDLLEQLVSGALDQSEARAALERFGFDLRRPVAVVALTGEEPAERLALACDHVLARRAQAFLTSAREDLVLAVLQPGAPGLLSGLRAALKERSPGRVLAGSGSLRGYEQLPQAVREACYALQVCRTEGRVEAEFADLGTYQLLLSLQDPQALRTFADSVLAPLDGYDQGHGGELIASLRAFLERNARWETAAADLFVHRHTLRYRMRKVEELTGRDLSSARDRMEFFLAMRARDLLESTRWPGRDGADATPSRTANAVSLPVQLETDGLTVGRASPRARRG